MHARLIAGGTHPRSGAVHAPRRVKGQAVASAPSAAVRFTGAVGDVAGCAHPASVAVALLLLAVAVAVVAALLKRGGIARTARDLTELARPATKGWAVARTVCLT